MDGKRHGSMNSQALTSTASESDSAPRVSDAVPRRFAGGNGLRIIAATTVLIVHAGAIALIWKHSRSFDTGEESPGQYKPLFGVLSPEFAMLRTGVYIFFVMSGYLLSRPFFAAYTLGKPLPSIARFLRNRALRIIPAFWLVVTIYVLWNHLTGTGGIVAMYAFAQNYHWTGVAVVMLQAWTLDIEVTYYLAVPIAALLALALVRRFHTTPRARLYAILVVLAIAYAVSLVCKHYAGSPANNAFNLADYMFAIVPGLTLAAIEPFAAPFLRGTHRGRLLARGLLALSLVLLGLFASLPMSAATVRLILVSIGCGALVAAPMCLQWATGGCWRVLDNRVMHWLGQRSYGIYLIHIGLMGHLVAHIDTRDSDRTTFALLLLAAMPLTLLWADLQWRFIERPAQQQRLPWRQVEFAGGAKPSVSEGSV
jgi:peptidoglycan/LPS O-acetylase OafA/YrhL